MLQRKRSRALEDGGVFTILEAPIRWEVSGGGPANRVAVLALAKRLDRDQG